MIVTTDKGRTEVHVKDFITVEPKVAQVREAFLSGKANEEKVEKWVGQNFGKNRFNREYDEITKGLGPCEALAKWDEWIEGQPLIHRKLYYDASIVAACIMSKEE